MAIDGQISTKLGKEENEEFKEEVRLKINNVLGRRGDHVQVMGALLACSQVQKNGGKAINFVLEHPSGPEEMPEVVSTSRTRSWMKLKQLYHLHQCEVDQGDLGSGTAKPTTL